MVDAFFPVAFAHLFADQPLHHDLDPLLSDNCISGIDDLFVLREINTFEGWRYFRLLPQEGFRLWSRHCEEVGRGTRKG